MNQSNSLKVHIPQKAAYSYDLVVGNGILENAGDFVKKYTNAKNFLIVTNEKVKELYGKYLKIDSAKWFVMKDGERYKNFDTLKKILDFALQQKLQRTDCIIAFGGGVAGDIAGFAASIYMRGTDFIQIPTTLLAQVDSSVGGKVAINHEKGKNLIGAFYQPKAVLADISVLKTLDLRQLKTGLAEVLKYAFIEKSCAADLNYRFYDFLNQNKEEIYNLNPEILSKTVSICCSLKAAIVNQDETEKGLRTILNLGHTFAHAIENLTNYTVYTHGEAVAAGMKMAFNLSLAKGFIDKDYYNKACKLIDDYDLIPSMQNFDKEKFYDKMFLDKKAQNGKIRFVLPSENFKAETTSDVTKEQVFEVL